MKISVVIDELRQIDEFFGDIETTTNDIAVVQGLDGDKVVRLGIATTIPGGLVTGALNAALADHEREMHNVPDEELVDMDDGCLADTKMRYDRLIRLP
jgi:hypothetical protein